MDPTTLTDLVFRSFDRFNRQVHFGFKDAGRWRTLTTRDVRDRVLALAGSLARTGICAHDRVAIISPTRYEWLLADYAVLALRGVVVPLYATLAPAQMAAILKHSGARLAFVAGRDEWTKLKTVRRDLPDLKQVVSFEPLAEEGVTWLDEFLKKSGPVPSERPHPLDLASIIYTSGTTGEPKGVMLTHGNVVTNVLACSATLAFTEADRHLSFLPMSHIFERMASYYMAWNGVTVYFAEDIGKVKENLLEVRPTLVTAVPRVMEKVLASIEAEAHPGSGLRPKVVRFAIDTARAWARAAWGERHEAPLWLDLKRRVADRLVLARVRERLGGRLRLVITGGAATPDAVTEFFLGAGVPVLPGYGLTETSPVIAFNTPSDFRFGTVGRILPGIEVRIAEDGEILVKGPSVMAGYYKNEEATREAIDPDGWFKTGDIGRLEAGGFLAITDRKKDLIATAGGKKIAPQPIEQALCQDPFISQAVLVGEGKPYIVALLVPHAPALQEWARHRGLPCGDHRALLGHPEVERLFRERVEAVSGTLARFETVKRFALIEHEFSEASGELTPTLKVKRRVVMERHRERIASLYS